MRSPRGAGEGRGAPRFPRPLPIEFWGATDFCLSSRAAAWPCWSMHHAQIMIERKCSGISFRSDVFPMKVLVTGCSGLIGSAAVLDFDHRGHEVTGIDNNMRRTFFGPSGDTRWNLD